MKSSLGISDFLEEISHLIGMLIHARRQQHCYKSTGCPSFLLHSQTDIQSKESWLMMTRYRCKTGNFCGFTSFISTPDFTNDETHQHHSYLNLLVNLGIVGLHGDPNIFCKALKHLSTGPAAQSNAFKLNMTKT